MDPHAALENLLRTLFNEAELKHFVQTDLGQRQLLDWVPREKVSKNELVANVVSALHRHGYIDAQLFKILKRVRTQQSSRIDEVWNIWRTAPPPPAPAQVVESVISTQAVPAQQASAWRSWLIAGLLSTLGIAALLGGVVFLQGYLLQREAIQSDKIILGELVHRKNEFFVIVRESTALAKRPTALSEELVLLPSRLTGFRPLDVCHLAVLVQPLSDSGTDKPADRPLDKSATKERMIELKVLDMHFDGQVCPEKFEQFLSKRWGITADISNFPSTFLRRAEQYNREGEQQKERRLSEGRYKMALDSMKTAMQLFQNSVELHRQAPARIDQRIGELHQLIRTQRLRINRVAERPVHELVAISGGHSITWHPEMEKQRSRWLPLFWLDRFEVSNIQYEQYWPDHRRRPATSEDRHPVVDVSWHDAENYCLKRGLRLPTEDEYEKAGSWSPRTQRAVAYPWQPPTLDQQQLNHLGQVHAVQEDPNGESEYRVLNLVGNVAEWTIRKHEGQAAPIYVIKGGSFKTTDFTDFAMWNAKASPDQPLPDVGFRCAATDRPRESESILVYDVSTVP